MIFVGSESAPVSKVIRSCRTTCGRANSTSNHCPGVRVPGAERQEVLRSPSTAAYGWCSGRPPPSGCACDQELDADTPPMPR